MADPGNSEEKRVAVDEDGRSTAEGQVYASEEVNAGMNRERSYGEYCHVPPMK
jgi:hypothetical protein